MSPPATPEPSAPSVADVHATLGRIVDGHADQFDLDQAVPPAVTAALAREGWLATQVPAEYGGQPLAAAAMGPLCEAFGHESASLLSLLTVHSMVCHAIARWGSPAQKDWWLARLAAGETLGAFALSEPEAGSDAKAVTTEMTRVGDALSLNGRKKWISFGQCAGLFLVVGKLDGKITTVLVPRETAGLSVTPIRNMLGFRSAMLAELQFDDCRLPRSNLIGSLDFGLAQVVGSVLGHGRFCIGWGAVGLAQAGLDASVAYAQRRVQFGQPIGMHQLVQQKIADMVTHTRAARLLCQAAAAQVDAGHPEMIMSTVIAKYFAATAAERIATDAVQLHGANGCSDDFPVQRHLRDARILNLIEGTTQIQQVMIARDALFRS